MNEMIIDEGNECWLRKWVWGYLHREWEKKVVGKEI